MARARHSAPWIWEAADAMRAMAENLRRPADTLDEQADRIDPPDLKRVG